MKTGTLLILNVLVWRITWRCLLSGSFQQLYKWSRNWRAYLVGKRERLWRTKKPDSVSSKICWPAEDLGRLPPSQHHVLRSLIGSADWAGFTVGVGKWSAQRAQAPSLLHGAKQELLCLQPGITLLHCSALLQEKVGMYSHTAMLCSSTNPERLASGAWGQPELKRKALAK